MDNEMKNLKMTEPATKQKSLEWVRENVKIPGSLDAVDSQKGKEYAGKELRPTDAFGEVHFNGATRNTIGQFVRVGNKTKAETAYTLMIDHWKMEQPKLMISVTGGAKTFNLDRRLKKQFATGLLKVAETPGAWVITGGTNTGVMKHVGEALKGATKACIGIATWGIVQNREALIEDDTANENQFKTFGGSFPYDVECSLIARGAFLDYNHTHFLLVDDGSNEYGKEIDFRSSVETPLVEKNVPSVLLVLEGGPGTLDTIKGSLYGNVPVVLIKDSGRAADLLVNILGRFSVTDMETICNSESTDATIMDMIAEKLPANPKKTDEENQNNFRKYYNVVIECLKQRKLITVFQMDNSSSVDEAILTALLNSNSASHVRQLQFTLLWNRPDLAEEKILTKNIYLAREELTDAMVTALATNRVQFVKLFLEHGISLARIVNKDVLQFLYGYCTNSPYSILDTEVRGSYIPVLQEPSATSKNVMEILCDDAGLDVNKSAVAWSRVHEIINDLCSDIRQGMDILTQATTCAEEVIKGKISVKKCRFRELFLWAVLNGMHEMALALWQFEEEGLMKALIGAEINNKLAEKAAGIANLPDEVEKSFANNAIEFQNLALQLLEECYKTDEKKTMKLITGKSEHFNGQTCLQVAVNSKNLEFVSHSSVQALLNDFFTGPMKTSLLNIKQYLLAVVFPPYLLSFDFRTEDELKEMATSDEKPAGTLMPSGLSAISMRMSSAVVKTDATNPKSTTQLIKGDRSKNYKTIDTTENINKSSQMSSFKKLMLFYFKTPCVKFYNSVVAYIIFLGLISFVAMEEKKSMPSPQEFIVIAFVVSFTLEEINQFVQSEFKSVTAKLKDYLSSKWNLIDIVAIVLFYIALDLRLNRSTEQFGHMLYAFDAAIWILRLLHVFYAHRIMGPYVVMIYRMFFDMMYFLTILVVFMVAYGVCAAAISVKHDNAASMLRDVFFRPYFNIYGELFIDRDPESSDMTRFGYPVINNYAEPVGWILLGSYLLIANVLLLNLLIAIFGNTFTKVQDNASQIWKFQRYELILEYANRPPLVPPFILLAHIYSFLSWLIKLWTCPKSTSTAGLKTLISDEEREILNKFESNCLSSFLRSRTDDDDAGKGSISDAVEKMKGLEKLLLNVEDCLKMMKLNTSKKDS